MVRPVSVVWSKHLRCARAVVDDEAALNGNHGLGTLEAEHGEQIDPRVGKPRNDSDSLRHADLSRDLVAAVRLYMTRPH